jgi:hypothetical protein
MGCSLLEALCHCVKGHLTSSSSQLLSVISFQLEQKTSSAQKIQFMMAVQTVFRCSHPVLSAFLVNRLTKAILPHLTPLTASSESRVDSRDASTAARTNRSKKRSRAFEGDELLRRNTGAVLDTTLDAQCILVTVDLLHLLSHEPNLSPSVRSLVSRIFLSLLLTLPHTLPSALSSKYELYTKLLAKTQRVAMDIGLRSSVSQSKTLGLMINSAAIHSSASEDLELVLHPRLPPLVRSLPRTEAIILTQSEESREEVDLRSELGLSSAAAEMSIDVDAAVEELPVRGLTPKALSFPNVLQSTVQTTETQVVSHAREARPPSAALGMEVDMPSAQTVSSANSSNSVSVFTQPPEELPPAQVESITTTTTASLAIKTTHAMDDDEEMPLIDDDTDSGSDSD